MTTTHFEHPGRIFALWTLLLVLAFCLLAMTDVGMLRHAKEVRAKDFRSHLEDAGFMLEARDFPGAIAKVETAMKLAPGEPETHAMLGHVQYRLQNWGPAIKAYHEALDLGSTDEGVRQNLIWSYIEIREYATAAAMGEASIEQGFKTPALTRYVAEAWFRGGEYAKAIPYLEVSLRTWPKDMYLLDHLRRALTETGNTERAKRITARMAEVGAALGQAAALQE